MNDENILQEDDKEHLHDRFLYGKDKELHFGCANPFCTHNEGMPNHYTTPLNTKDFQMKLLSHKDRKVRIEVILNKTGEKQILECNDNLRDCGSRFKELSWKNNAETPTKKQ